MKYFQRILNKVISLEGKRKTENSGRNDKNNEKQFHTECVEGKMKGCLSLVFFFLQIAILGEGKNCIAGVRKFKSGIKRIG